VNSATILLTGFMGSGKSTVGKALAEILEVPFFDLDQEILSRNDFPTISYIIKEKGEAFFRQLEQNTLFSLLDSLSGVLALGGGTVIADLQNDINDIRESIHSRGATLVYLQTSFDDCRARIEKELNCTGENSRPLFENIRKAELLYHQRLPLYEDFADITICTNRRTPEDIASEIKLVLNKK